MSAPAAPPPVPPPSEWLATALFEIKGTLGDHGATLARLDERTAQLSARVDKVDVRLWWLVTFMLTSLAAQVATLVAVLLRR